jgi:hypothetical protein
MTRHEITSPRTRRFDVGRITRWLAVASALAALLVQLVQIAESVLRLVDPR